MSVEEQISQLIDKYERETGRRDQPEADVRANYIDWLFHYLGWDVWKEDSQPTNRYHREGYQRGAGFVDVGLEITGERSLILEAKRFGLIPHSQERKGDRTPEEKQLFAYARRRGIPYGILTNFERLQVFNTDHEVLILSFDNPTEYLDRLDELQRLSPDKVKAGSLQDWERKREIKPIDKEFLTSLQDWRLRLANTIYEHNLSNSALQSNGSFDFDKLMAAVQRILDRLILIRYADDREVLQPYDILHTIISYYHNLGAYSRNDHLLREFIELSHKMDEYHNTTLFQPGHLCEQVFIPNEVLASIIKEMNNISFRKFTSDILGNTYETYLGTKLALKNGEIKSEERRDIRKAGGIFYTPTFVVRYIVDNTLGQLLKELESQHGLQAIEKAQEIRVLDPACGSGSFLIYAYQVLADFYRWMNEAIGNEQVRLLASGVGADMFERIEQFKHLPKPLENYPHHILEKQLYGVDIDPEAAEIAAVNLTMQAFADTKREKLPLILNENIKVGNSLISGTEEELKGYFGDNWRDKKPFNWEREFKDIMAKGGFDVVIGNPPWASFSGRERQSLPDDERNFLTDTYSAFRGWPAIHSCFVQRALSLLSLGGYFAFILPAQVATLATYRNLRNFILQNCQLISVSFTGEQVFGEVVSPTVILVATKRARDESYVEIRRPPTELTKIKQSTIENTQWKRFISFEFLPGVRWDKCLSLGDAVRDSGVHTGNVRAKLLSKHQSPMHNEAIFQGKDVSRYAVGSPSLYLAKDYRPADHEYFRIKDESMYLVAKILLRQTASEIVATFDSEGKYFLNSLLAIYKMKDYHPSYILALLNSSLFRQYYRRRFQEADQKSFPQVKVNYLRELPIRRIDFNNPKDKKMHDDLVVLVDRMLELNKRLAPIRNTACVEQDELLHEIEKTDQEIDNLVYERYGITEEERQVIEASS